jgi:uroporphyrinogen-III synthase
MNFFRFLVTKKLKPSLSGKAVADGIDVIEKELIKIVPISTDEKKKEVLKLLDEHAIVAFTSKNAVKALSALMGEADKPFWKIFCLEGATLQEVKKVFPSRNIIDTAADAKHLAKKIIEAQGGKHILFFCGDKRRDDLPETLKQKGFSVNEMVIYKTELTPVVCREEFDGIGFFSPSAVDSFFSVNKIAPRVLCFSIGQTTTSTIKKYTTNSIITCDESSEQRMMEEVMRAKKKK